jgi:hypothetical protein
MTEIMISDDVCWLCGKPANAEDPLTSHHALAQVLNPAKNIRLPIHESCHKRVTAQDINSLYGWVEKLSKNTRSQAMQVGTLLSFLESHSKIKVKGEKE